MIDVVKVIRLLEDIIQFIVSYNPSLCALPRIFIRILKSVYVLFSIGNHQISIFTRSKRVCEIVETRSENRGNYTVEAPFCFVPIS